MIIFWRLLLAHLLGDFTFQTNRIAAWKRKNFTGILLHSSMFLVLSFILCSFNEDFVLSSDFLTQTWWKFPGWLSIILIFITHLIEDYYRVWSIKKGGSSDNILFFIWDQMIHIISIFLFSPVGIDSFIAEKWVVVAILVVLVTHFTTIFIYYIEISFFNIHEQPSKRLEGKYWLIIERLVIFGCLLLPDKWWAVFLIVLLIRPFVYRILKTNNFSQLNVVVSTIFAIGLGFLTRLVLY